MPLPPPPAGLLAQIKAKKNDETGGPPMSGGRSNNKSLLAAIQQRSAVANSPATAKEGIPAEKDVPQNDNSAAPGGGKLYAFNDETNAFVFDFTSRDATTPRLAGAKGAEIVVPLAPCVYRMTDYTFSKKEPISLSRIVNKLGVLRCLERECGQLNRLIASRVEAGRSLEEEELGKSRFMELISNCGIFQKVSELILPRCNAKSYDGKADSSNCVPRVRVEGLSEFLERVEDLVPALASARKEIRETQTVNFHPGLGELFCPGSQLVCFPDGMEGTPLGVSVVQSWYDEELNRATNKTKRRFILVVEFVVSVGTELVFVAASEVYPEFHDAARNVNVRDLNHRRLDPLKDTGDAALLSSLQERGEFYASVATDNHYLEYHPGCFFPIVGGWANNSTRPLSKSGRVMVDTRRSFQEGHIPIRGSSDGMSDTVKEAMKLFEQSKRTGVAVPFRTAILPEFYGSGDAVGRDSDRHQLWMSWPMLTGFSFTARVWGKLLLSLPKASAARVECPSTSEPCASVASRRPYILGGTGRSGSVSYINFQEKAFDQLVLSEDKKELIRAVARNAGVGGHDSDDDSDDDEIGLDVVANKGAASIFLLSGPPGCGKTLTAEAIAELLKKPLYVVTAGDLGITASEVEKSFGGVLDLCSTWDALVLVDEADIFLEARSSTEIQRNALVCVMLRLLEYYFGCLFLSSNRDAKSIDPAIASRITVMLSYPPLDAEGRAKVWKNLVELVPVRRNSEGLSARKLSRYRLDFTTKDYETLAQAFDLNGRQIKNSIVLARALAKERGVSLSLDILVRAVTAVAGEACHI